MRRVGRYILDGLTGLSLLVCVGTCGLWVRSYWQMDATSIHAHVRNDRLHSAEVSSRVGVLSAEWQTIHVARGVGPKYDRDFHSWNPDTPAGRVVWRTSNPAADVSWAKAMANLVRFRWGWGYEPSGAGMGVLVGISARFVELPHWAATAATAALPLLRGWRARRRRQRSRALAGRCPACGYDLRATPGRCPECGLVRGSVNGAAEARG